ncbi:hypothetical protein LQ567_05000 [Niabella pedocola]|uniref:General stress protein CsbD n=1 Tax=Niabella pedocola TaxID=1752077 RepID=A0ABS8PLX7_9BACT|nr:hypothetical protein [Niabella pedocola]MCD2422109.1 hypothetical protein [Niabella pedocola]
MYTGKITSNENFKMIGDWTSQSKILKERYPLLADADLKFEKGKENDLLARVGTRLNKKRDEVVNILKKVQPSA